MADELDHEEPVGKHITYWPAFLIVFFGLLSLYFLQYGGLTIIRPIIDFSWAIGAINVLLYIWLRVISGLSAKTQCQFAVGLIVVQCLALICFRLDGFDGTGRFIAKWRWSPTPEQQLEQYGSEPVRSSTISLGAATPFDSPAFRGANRDGAFQFPNSVNFSTCSFKEIWRRPVGRGWSSYAAVGNYCFTQEQIGDSEAVSCYRISTSELIWQQKRNVRFDEITSGSGPRATPAFADGKVVCFGATGWLQCLDAMNGKLIWEKCFCSNPKDGVLFGFSGSPLIINELIYLTVGAPNESLVAIELNTGRVAWSMDQRKAGYSSPHPFQHEVGISILVFDAVGLHAYDAINGQHQWSFDWGDNSDEQVNVCQPVVIDSNRILISSGYGRGSAMLQIEKSADRWRAVPIWKSKRLRSKFSSIVIKDGYAFGLDEGILTCIELTSGRRVWKSGRYGHGQLLLSGNVIFVQAEKGELVLVEASPERFRELRRVEALSDRTWNYPVLVREHLLIRNDREAVCFQVGQ